jgi:subtilisin family serine protease
MEKKNLRSVAVIALFAALEADAVPLWTNRATATNPERLAVRSAERAPFVQGEFLVKAPSFAALERLFDRMDPYESFAPRIPLIETEAGGWYKVTVRRTGEALFSRLISTALEHLGIISIEPNYLYSIQMGPGRPQENGQSQDLRMGELYGLRKIEAPEAWNTTRGSRQVVVADIDTGADYNHEDLINNIWRNPGETPQNGVDDDGNGFVDDVVGWDFRDADPYPLDDNQHGTHTAGIIGATGGNGLGISGVAPQVSLMILRFMGGGQGAGTTESAIQAIQYALANGADIISSSWGGYERSQALEDAVRATEQRGTLFIAAAGNYSSNNDQRPTYPASYPFSNVISVAASDENDNIPRFSNFGRTTVHLAAPGTGILSTIPGGYKKMDGTSMACPHVSGAAALIRAAYPHLRSSEIKGLLLDAVDRNPILAQTTITGGRLNVARALQLALSRYGSPTPIE